MKIGLNLLFLIPGSVGGTETYATSLLRALGEIDRANEYHLFVSREAAEAEWVRNSPFVPMVCPVRARSRAARYAWEQAVLPAVARRHRLDLLHSLGYVAPLHLGCASVVTIHDLNYEAIPDSFGPVRHRVLSYFVPRSARRADAILTLSEASRRQIVSRLRVPSGKVFVTPCAAKTRPAGFSPMRTEGTRPDLVDPYLLALSSSSPHKNIPRLLHAFAEVRAEMPLRLVLVGHEPSRGEPLRRTVADLGLEAAVAFTGYVSDQRLFELLDGATAFVFPSLYEGFGIPVLEAMEAGVPVVASRAASLPEVVGDAGILCDPSSVSSIAEALRRVLASSELRSQLSQRGVERAARFSWENTARETLRVYEAVGRAAKSGGGLPR